MEAVKNQGVINLPDYHAVWYTSERHSKKSKRIVDICQFVGDVYGQNDQYEVMYMDGYGNVLDCFRTFEYSEAIYAYSRMVRSNAPDSWKSLIEALESAKEIARAVDCDDGGTCNFDAPSLHIPEGMSYEQVAACCAAAYVHCFKWRCCGETMAVLSSCSGIGQGNRRTEGSEQACKFLNQRGYSCGMYYQMD